ncbi:MAG TPA: hypothetical protein VN598_02620 [Usitatibacter sp.]|nr:hypothetical protein [Usitatibacter sp.]
MSPKILLSIAFLLGAAAQAAEASPSGGHPAQPSAAQCASAQASWFEQQRQLTDGNVEPRHATLSVECAKPHLASDAQDRSEAREAGTAAPDDSKRSHG